MLFNARCGLLCLEKFIQLWSRSSAGLRPGAAEGLSPRSQPEGCVTGDNSSGTEQRLRLPPALGKEAGQKTLSLFKPLNRRLKVQRDA